MRYISVAIVACVIIGFTCGCSTVTSTQRLGKPVATADAKKLEGVWLSDGFTFPLSASRWDDFDIHRAHAVALKDKWIYVYDAWKEGEWRIGVATIPLR